MKRSDFKKSILLELYIKVFSDYRIILKNPSELNLRGIRIKLHPILICIAGF